MIGKPAQNSSLRCIFSLFAIRGLGNEFNACLIQHGFDANTPRFNVVLNGQSRKDDSMDDVVVTINQTLVVVVTRASGDESKAVNARASRNANQKFAISQNRLEVVKLG